MTSRTTKKTGARAPKSSQLPPLHPGEILEQEFLLPLGITPYRLAKSIKVDPPAIAKILRGERAITVEMAMLLGAFFDMEWRFWINLQNQYDAERAAERLAPKLAAVEPHKRAA
jgi:addiction module HigA family antidote